MLSRLVGTDRSGRRRWPRRRRRRRRKMNHKRLVAWPLRPKGMRRRASAPRLLTKGRLSRPAGWMVRLFVLMLIAVPSLMITSPGYVAYADKLTDLGCRNAPAGGGDLDRGSQLLPGAWR